MGYRGFHLALLGLNGFAAESLHILKLFLCLDLGIIVRDLLFRLDVDLVVWGKLGTGDQCLQDILDDRGLFRDTLLDLCNLISIFLVSLRNRATHTQDPFSLVWVEKVLALEGI